MTETTTATWTRTHRIEAESPGIMFSELSHRDVPERTIKAALKVMPDTAFRFRFYDALVAVVSVEGVPQTVRKAENHSAWHYLGGTIHTAEEVEVMGGHDILLSNMRGNHWDRVIHTPMGNWHPWEADFVYVNAAGEVETS